MSIFDEPEFKHSPNGNGTKRLDIRHTGIIDWNRHLIKGKQILDLGYHDGRWSYAAMLAGASQCSGIEITDLWKKSFGIFKRKGLYNPDVTQDDMVNLRYGRYDTCLCLGVLYHSFHFVEVLRRIAKHCDNLILDTMVAPDKEKTFINIRTEGDKEGLNNPNDDYVMVPTLPALMLILNNLGYKDIELFSYPVTHMADYDSGRRITLRARI